MIYLKFFYFILFKDFNDMIIIIFNQFDYYLKKYKNYLNIVFINSNLINLDIINSNLINLDIFHFQCSNHSKKFK